MVELGEATGVIAAQSIGEPGTQLTMRTFHIGGTARIEEQSSIEAKNTGVVHYLDLKTVENKEGDRVVLNRTGFMVVQDPKGRELERHAVVYGATLKVADGLEVHPGDLLVQWDPYTFAILTEAGGKIQFKDIIDGTTIHEERDEVTGFVRQVIVESTDETKQPAIIVQDKSGKNLRSYLLPSGALLMVEDQQVVFPGHTLAKIPRATTKTKDITGGLPRVVELFEARKPKEPAIITEIDGMLHYGEVAKGMRTVTVSSDSGEEREYSIPKGLHLNVQEGERVRAGEPLIDGPINPHDILSVLGKEALQRYLVNEIQEVYRLQGVNINDKHIEVIVRQMMRWVKVEDVGDTEFIVDEQVDKFRFQEENVRVLGDEGEPSTGRPLLLGITKASLSTDSFISAASFQETTRVLTEASISGKVDYLRGLKENVIMGRLIPAGTGMDFYRRMSIEPDQTERAASDVPELDVLEQGLGAGAVDKIISAGAEGS
jgi:DNA-directed RNA polymerase subunit beta'